jgi:hypothetical protein
MSNLFKQSMFRETDKFYLPLAKFSAPGSGNLKQEVQDAIANLNAKAIEFSYSKSFSSGYLDLIAQAETLATNNHLPEAQKAIWQATFFLNRALDSTGATKFRKWMSLYYGCWLLLLVGLGWWLNQCGNGCDSACCFGFTYWRYIFMGALGGLTIAIWGLIEHSANLDFDRAYAVWYWLKPLLGAVMGLIAVFAVLAGLFAVEGKQDIQSEKALYIVAFLAGFSERFFIRIIDKLMTTLLGGDQPSPASKSGAPNGSTSGSGKLA